MEKVFHSSFSMLPPLPCSAFPRVTSLVSGARTRVELGCAHSWEGRRWAPAILCKYQSGAPGERMTRGRHGRLPSISHPNCIPLWCCTQGRTLCLLGLSPSKQLVISACAQIGMASSWSHINSLLCCCLILNLLTGGVNNCGLLKGAEWSFYTSQVTDGLLGKQVWAVRVSISKMSLLSPTFATFALLGLWSWWKVMLY